MDARVGGTFRMSFTNFTTGNSHAFGGEYLELTPHERIRYTDKFDDPNLPGEMQVTVTLNKVSVGTELNVEQAGVPDVIPVEACYLGWQESLTSLPGSSRPRFPVSSVTLNARFGEAMNSVAVRFASRWACGCAATATLGL
jgi:hypothetical protein